MTVAEHEPAPDFEMPATGGRTVSLRSMRGKPFVLYFYPKADTPGCTKEACAFQEALPQLGRLGIEVIGVSKDKMPALEKFAAKYRLEFSLGVRRRVRRGGGLWHLGREIDVWPQIHGDGTQHVPDRQGRQGGTGVAQSERDETRRGGDGSGGGAEIVAAYKREDRGQDVGNKRIAIRVRRGIALRFSRLRMIGRGREGAALVSVTAWQESAIAASRFRHENRSKQRCNKETQSCAN